MPASLAGRSKPDFPSEAIPSPTRWPLHHIDAHRPAKRFTFLSEPSSLRTLALSSLSGLRFLTDSMPAQISIAWYIFLLLAMTALVAPKRTSPVLATLALLYLAQRFNGLARYYIRLAVYIAGLASISLAAIPAAVVMRLLGQKANVNYVVARVAYYLISPLLGLTITVEGAEHIKQARPAVLVGNHQSMLDILYLGAFFPTQCSIMAKKELKWVPLLGQWMWLSNAVFVNRTNRQDAMKAFQKVGETMRRKAVSLFIFVEGTRSSTEVPSLLPFKKGAFHLAVQSDLPIVPVVCENYNALYNAKDRFNSGEIILKVLPPVSTQGRTSSHEDIEALVHEVREKMLDALEELACRPNSIGASRKVERDGQKALEWKQGKRRS